MNRRIGPILVPGTPVTITFGPFRALRAVVVTTSRKRVVVRCAVADRSFLVELDDSMVDEAMLHGPAISPLVSDSISECAP